MTKPTAILLVAAVGATSFVGCLSPDDSPPPPDAGALDAPALGDAGAYDAALDAGVDSSFDATSDSSFESGLVESGLVESGLVESGLDATPDAMTTDAADAMSDGPAPLGSVYVDPVNGVDTNDGSNGAPVKTLSRAATLVNGRAAGVAQTVYLADGTYDSTNQPDFFIAFMNPTFVRASAPGKATLVGIAGQTSAALSFFAGGGVANVALKAIPGGLSASAGTFDVSGVSFDGVTRPFDLGGSVVATIDTTAVLPFTSFDATSYTACMQLGGSAKVSWKTAGTLTGTLAACVTMYGGSQLTIDGLSMQNVPGYAVILYDQAQLTLGGATLTNVAPTNPVSGDTTQAPIWMGMSQSNNMPTAPAITLNNSTIAASAGHAIAYSTDTSRTNPSGSFTFTSSHIDNNKFNGLSVNGTAAVTIQSTSTTFDGNGYSGISVEHPAAMTITGGSMSRNGATASVSSAGAPYGLFVSGLSAPNTVSLRNVALGGNTGGGVYLSGAAGSTFDLGTAASPGRLTFSGVTSGKSALLLAGNGTALAATAIGNTWMPSVQGADAAGHYTTTTTIVGPASGLNVYASQGSSVVLAQ